MSPDVNVHDREELLRSLNHWRLELNASTRKLKLYERRVEDAHKAVQVARARIERRSSQLAKIPVRGPRRAVALALQYVGTAERPANSNTGKPFIDSWQSRFGIHAQPWCGAFVGAMVNQAGAHVSGRTVFTPYIYDDAVRHRNGMAGVVWLRGHGWQEDGAAHSGDLVLFDFGTTGIKHVGMLVQPWKGKSPLQTVEGNTSFGKAGSQDNGGAVARRSRDASLVHSIVSVRWPA